MGYIIEVHEAKRYMREVDYDGSNTMEFRGISENERAVDDGGGGFNQCFPMWSRPSRFALFKNMSGRFRDFPIGAPAGCSSFSAYKEDLQGSSRKVRYKNIQISWTYCPRHKRPYMHFHLL